MSAEEPIRRDAGVGSREPGVPAAAALPMILPDQPRLPALQRPAVPLLKAVTPFSERSGFTDAFGSDGVFELRGGDRLGPTGVAFDLAMDWHPQLMRAVEKACEDQRILGRDWFVMPPTLLLGPDGVGRTHIARRLATAAGVPHVEFDLADPHIGRHEAAPDVRMPLPPFVGMWVSRCANPVVSVVNVDRAGPVGLSLLQRLVDPRVNGRVVASALAAQFDLSQVTWLVQSGAADALPARLHDLLVEVGLEDTEIDDSAFLKIDLIAEVVADFALEPPSPADVEEIVGKRHPRGHPARHVGVAELYADIARRLRPGVI